MASLHEYFLKDGASNMTTHRSFTIADSNGAPIGNITARLHLDFEARAKYISFYIPDLKGVECPEALVLNSTKEILNWTHEDLIIQDGFESDGITDARELIFSGRIYLYSERPVPEPFKNQLRKDAEQVQQSLIFRSQDYAEYRSRWEKPLAFISHDSRDKIAIAQPLASQLQKFMCPVWFDEYSLRVGDSLRQSIEKGLKECKKCIVILTPNFLANGGWSKREYDSVFTRELVEKEQLILPIWHEVSFRDVYEYSPVLADRFAVQWKTGVEEVARKLVGAINA